jgi:hypothetical protein
VRVLAIGDFGVEGPNQRAVAAAAVAYHRETPFDLGVTLSDNFLPEGVTSPSDPLGIPFFAPTGNHDWGWADSSARWKIVYGHHPIYSHGAHGDTPGLHESLLPLLKNRVHIYLVGHEHTAQHLKPEEGVHFFTGAAGCQTARPIRTGPLTLFADSFYGFVALEIDEERIKVTFVDTEGTVRYETEITE